MSVRSSSWTRASTWPGCAERSRSACTACRGCASGCTGPRPGVAGPCGWMIPASTSAATSQRCVVRRPVTSRRCLTSRRGAWRCRCRVTGRCGPRPSSPGSPVGAVPSSWCSTTCWPTDWVAWPSSDGWSTARLRQRLDLLQRPHLAQRLHLLQRPPRLTPWPDPPPQPPPGRTQVRPDRRRRGPVTGRGHTWRGLDVAWPHAGPGYGRCDESSVRGRGSPRGAR